MLASTAALVVLLAGCSAGSSPSSAASAGSSSPAASATTSSESPTAGASDTSIASPSASATGSTACTTAQLTVALGQTDSAAGNQYTPIVFTNRGAAACTMTGFPGVAFLTAAGRQVGPSAVREAQPVQTVQLPVGGSAHAIMDFHDAGLYSASACQAAAAAYLQVYPPNQTTAVRLASSQQVCTQAMSSPQLTVRPVSPGVSSTP
jgi:hypothetical protein